MIKLNRKIYVPIISILLTTYAIASLKIYPHYLSYFNILAGGPKNGYQHLIDSNIDWGQDLILLKEYMEENNIYTIHLAYFGWVDPEVYGINYEILKPESKGGTAAISVNYYQGYPFYIIKKDSVVKIPFRYYDFVHKYQIKDRAGYSILIFDLPDE